MRTDEEGEAETEGGEEEWPEVNRRRQRSTDVSLKELN